MNKKMILAGGCGFLGGLLANYFRDRGWDIVILTRAKPAPRSYSADRTAASSAHASEPNADGSASPAQSAPSPQPNGTASYVEWDGRTIGEWATTFNGARVVINLAGRSVNCRYHAHNRKRIMDSRVNSTCVIGQAIARCEKPPPVWFNLSTATIYKHTFGDGWDETGEFGADPAAKDAFSIDVATAWEDAFGEACVPKTRKVALRSAMVFGLSNDANNVFRVLRRLVRCGLGGAMGCGRQWVSWIHESDFCRAIEFLIANDAISGPVNLAAPNPLPNADMMQTFRQILRMPIGLPAPRWMLEIGAFLLRTETELIIKSRRVIPGRLREAGFQFEFETLPTALANLEDRLHSPDKRVPQL